jgi:RNA polymerase sigma-B factor
MSDEPEPPPEPAESRAIELLRLLGSETPAISSRFTTDLVARARAQHAIAAPLRAVAGLVSAIAVALLGAVRSRPCNSRAGRAVRNGVDPATQNEERLLFTRLRTNRTAELREQAFRRFLPLARSLAARYRRSGEPLEDLEQVACIGLLNAIDRFDPDRGAAFSSFAVPTILGELRRHFRDRTWAVRPPRHLQELAVRIDRVRDELTSSLGRPPTIAELATRLETDEETVLQALELSLARHTASLTAPRPGEDEPEPPGRVDEGYARAEDRAVLAPLLATLGARDAAIVFLRFREDLTQDAIAERVGVSQMHVSRVLHRSLVHLRDAAA